MYNLIIKYAIIGAVLALAGVFLAGLLGMHMAMGYVSAAIAGAVGGAIGGFIRQKQAKSN
jgi:outer membrane lipoprotein SlyB